MKLIISAFLLLQWSWGQVNFTPSWVVDFRQRRPSDDYIMAPYDIIFDSTKGAVMPKMYRSPIFFKHASHQKIDLSGFNDLQISGSGQYSWLELKELVTHIHENHKIPYNKIYIFDFREEPHAFINDAAVSWFYGPLHIQQNKSPQEVIESELKRVNQVRAFPTVLINTIEKSADGMPSAKETGIYQVDIVMREQEAVKSLGVNYVRLPVTDHFRPEERDIDDFLAVIKELPAGSWLHFKCRGGKGRTTTFMTIFDIIQNPKVDFEEILARQKAIGGTDFATVRPKIGQAWKQRYANDRAKLIQVFYEYRHADDGWDKMKFSDWVKKHVQYLGYLGDRYDIE
ncbi:hypothetical protein [Candidatus Odyssella acanthamoebae]|uniref:Tyrosine specific protein phosphatases domain-containing protein n=1 Tax=Candidatus Odyssella acanthamoebae TaxID=91604 RepID=A0A077AUF8_9PROT|nr:hypothetical protein [Candidatus Paracaedibacter acanthamoebae]AIK96001.1 hypothetical protein ID47_03475 [Candidatus Paracaedibacter acanthamoebae]